MSRTMRLLQVAALALVGLFPAAASAHPATGIVVDAQGRILFSDLETVWRLDAGGRLDVSYRASARVGAAQTLVLRARLRRPGDASVHEQVEVARLRRAGDRTFAGSLTLPDSAVYAVFAVENTAADRVDAGYERWEVLLHGADGRPLFDALHQQYQDLRMRDSERAQRAAAEIAKLYPDEPRGWLARYFEATRNRPRAASDSIQARLREELRVRLPHLDSTGLEAVASVAWYAGAIDDTATERVWHDRLLRRFPDTRAAKQRRALRLLQQKHTSRAAFWHAAEALWAETGPKHQEQLLFSAFESARALNEPQGIERWGERWVATDPDAGPSVISSYMTVPALRERGMEHIRAYLRRLDEWPDERRPLSQTRPAFHAQLDGRRAQMLTRLGRALLQKGERAAALDTLGRAVEMTWDPALFRSVAEARAQAGDTAGAVPLLARVAIDPETPPTFADSVRARFPGHLDSMRWTHWTTQASARLARHVMRQATNRAVRGRFTLVAPDGGRVTFDGANATESVVALWCRECPPSRAQLAALDQLARELVRRRVRVIAITSEDPQSAELSAFVRRQRFTFLSYGDPDRQAARALDASGYPTYLVLDRGGRIRFESHRPDDVLRQVWLLRGERVRPAD